MPAQDLAGFVPPGVTIQEHSGTAWVGVVPFRMEGVMHRPLPDIPGLSAFAELNLRLYVDVAGKAGVWFISLDAANRLAVWAARTLFHLPYFYASMQVERAGQQIRYESLRKSSSRRVAFKGAYWPIGAVYESKPGSLEHFLTERYCLYTQLPDGTIARADVHHQPWPLQPAGAEIEENTIAQPQGIQIAGAPALLHFSRRLDVVVWPPKRITEA